MKITSISYQAVKNLGNYESERLEATATVENGEDVASAISQLRALVNQQLEDKVTDAPDFDPFDDPDYDPLFNPEPKSNIPPGF